MAELERFSFLLPTGSSFSKIDKITFVIRKKTFLKRLLYINDFYKTLEKLHTDVLNCAVIHSIIIMERVDR